MGVIFQHSWLQRIIEVPPHPLLLPPCHSWKRFRKRTLENKQTKTARRARRRDTCTLKTTLDNRARQERNGNKTLTQQTICQRVRMATVFWSHQDRTAGWEGCSHTQSTRWQHYTVQRSAQLGDIWKGRRGKNRCSHWEAKTNPVIKHRVACGFKIP